ncbi:hypothetical protein M3914_003376 [Vibrio metschnikovii]|nr:hypothetical protein [Vibrio metschnikovii]
MSGEYEILTVDSVSKKLKGIVSDDYQWPVVPDGYQLEFILHPDGSIILDFLNTEKGIFWSEVANEVMETPFKSDGSPITWETLKTANIPFMS